MLGLRFDLPQAPVAWSCRIGIVTTPDTITKEGADPVNGARIKRPTANAEPMMRILRDRNAVGTIEIDPKVLNGVCRGRPPIAARTLDLHKVV
jgi:hypothetical protein